MTSKRATARAEAAVMIDIEARLAPFFGSHAMQVTDLDADLEPSTPSSGTDPTSSDGDPPPAGPPPAHS